jgi:hypothetical protein
MAVVAPQAPDVKVLLTVTGRAGRSVAGASATEDDGLNASWGRQEACDALNSCRGEKPKDQRNERVWTLEAGVDEQSGAHGFKLDEAMGPRPRRCGYPSVLVKTKWTGFG